MKFKFQIIKDEQRLDAQVYDAESQEAAQLEFDKWFQIRKERKTFGDEAYSYQVLVTLEIPEIKEIQIIDGIETEVVTQEYQPAVYQTINVPAEYEIEITDITEEYEAQVLRAQKDALREMIKSKCTKALDEIMNYNLTNDFSIQEIDQLEDDFGEIHSALSKYRIDKAIGLLQATTSSELLTQEFINSLIAILTD